MNMEFGKNQKHNQKFSEIECKTFGELLPKHNFKKAIYSAEKASGNDC